MSWERSLESDVAYWAEALERRGLADLTLPFLEVLQVWGLAAAQLVWMLVPLVERSDLSALALILEQPEGMQMLRERLLEGATGE